jgi:hypothetical protein
VQAKDLTDHAFSIFHRPSQRLGVLGCGASPNQDAKELALQEPCCESMSTVSMGTVHTRASPAPPDHDPAVAVPMEAVIRCKRVPGGVVNEYQQAA